jgi:hypothetical protein
MNHHPENAPTTEDHETFGGLLSDMMRDLGTLFRQEVDLARLEVLEKAEQAKGGVLKMGFAAALGIAGIILLAGAAALGLTLLLALVMPPLGAACLSTLMVGILLAGGGSLLFRQGARDAKAAEFVPRRTLDTLKENAQWAKRQLH